MQSHRLATARGRAWRALPALLVAAVLLLGTFGPPVRPARAEHEPARLEVVVKSVYILNDEDWIGSGEMRLWMGLWTCDVRAAVYPCWRSEDFPPRVMGGLSHKFSVSSDETEAIDRVFPQPGNSVDGELVSDDEPGFPVYPRRDYRLAFTITEDDPTAVELG